MSEPSSEHGPLSSKHESDERLSRIATRWSIVHGAHDRPDDDAESLRRALVDRYSAAAYRYLLGAVRDPEIADELCQEFAVRCLQGDFHRADPQRGRFRDYVKKTLINMANQHHRGRKRWPDAFPSDAFEPAAPQQAPEADASFEECLRDELLEATWDALDESQPRYHSVLKLRIEAPDLSSREMSEELSRRLGKQLSPDTIRKTVERARARFAELLLDEVARSSGADSLDDVQRELEQLNLLKYCRGALQRRAEKDRVQKR